MSTGNLIAIIVPIAVVLILLALAAWYLTRRRRLQERFGPEYERTVRRSESRFAAERDLRAREQRHDRLDIRPLPAPVRDRYAEDWTQVQQQFVDQPGQAVQQADRLVTVLMRERGYPTEGYEQELRDLSVEHGRTLEHFRAAHAVNERAGSDKATTEELRGAMVHYRALFDELLGDGNGRTSGGRT
ncbi:hypothetical protein [Kitasatospora sp. GP82]|uniref:hypothetical protein n=1 Tax=Kitasatospora sp. GP82 TaxID=3035089 RepID=UPI002473B063|nr:hypothetical protein [Kitasatospora sp. GP82]MDH6129019.1 FtsZ-interacting cell division protein ZipA [Kitasatospora sp. GP82]